MNIPADPLLFMRLDYYASEIADTYMSDQPEWRKLDSRWIKTCDKLAESLDQEWRVGSASSDVNPMRYTRVHDMLRRHGREIRFEVRRLLGEDDT